MDFVKGMSLKEFTKMQRDNAVKLATARRIFKQLAEGIYYLHSRNIAHRDIKLDNVLIEETTRAIKLIDFGFSVVTPSDGGKLKIFCGTPSYMAPELVRKHSYDGKQVDMWALGVLLYVMLTGVLPFRGSTEKELFDKI